MFWVAITLLLIAFGSRQSVSLERETAVSVWLLGGLGGWQMLERGGEFLTLKTRDQGAAPGVDCVMGKLSCICFWDSESLQLGEEKEKFMKAKFSQITPLLSENVKMLNIILVNIVAVVFGEGGVAVEVSHFGGDMRRECHLAFLLTEAPLIRKDS